MIDPEIKAIFPEKSEADIERAVHNPCEDCAYWYEDCKNWCILGRLWQLWRENNKKGE